MDLVVDTRERELYAALRAAVAAAAGAGAAGGAVGLRQAQLDLGDVHLVARRRPDAPDAPQQGPGAPQGPEEEPQPALVVERKTLSDLAASVKDGRYREQQARLAGALPADRIMYVLEGGSEALCYDERMAQRRPTVNGLPAAALQGCVASLLLRERVRVVPTRDVGDTAALLLRLAAHKSWAEAAAAAPAAHASSSGGYEAAACLAASAVKARKRDNVDGRAAFMRALCQVPGVSARLAAVIAGRFRGSMADMYAELLPLGGAKPRAAVLARLPGVGPKIAGRVVELLVTPAPASAEGAGGA